MKKLPSIFAISISFFNLLVATWINPLSAEDTSKSSSTNDLSSNKDLYVELESYGFFPGNLQAGLKEMILSQIELQEIQSAILEINKNLPARKNDLQKIESQRLDLQKKWDELNNRPETSFTEIQKIYADKTIPLTKQLSAVESYIWGYPTSPHLEDARKMLADLQGIQQAQIKAAQDAEAARLARLDYLKKGAKARTLTLSEWKEFLLNLSQDEVLASLGTPSRTASTYWYYDDPIVMNASMQAKVGLVINFNGTRIIGVAPQTTR